MTFTPKTAYIVSHTHWDREWYLSYHTFRVKLVSMVRRVLARAFDRSEMSLQALGTDERRQMR